MTVKSSNLASRRSLSRKLTLISMAVFLKWCSDYKALSEQGFIVNQLANNVSHGALFPLNGRRRLTRDVIDYPVNATDFINDAVADFAQQTMR